jgi:hypothetical protein
MLLCSPVLVSLCLHLLAFFDLMFLSTRAPQPSFTVSLSCFTHPCTFCASTFYAMCSIYIQCTISLLYISVVAHSSFFTLEITLHNHNPHIFFVLHTSILYTPCAYSLVMLLHDISMSISLPDHHCNSSTYLAVKPMLPSSLVVMPRFLHLSSSQDSLSSLLQLRSTSLLQLQASTLFHLSITSITSLHSTGRFLETLQLL